MGSVRLALVFGLALVSQCWATSRFAPERRRPHAQWPSWRGIDYMFIFGDSYTTTGFNVSLEQPNPANPLGNPAYPGWTASNGPNWVDFLSTTYNNSYIQTYNLAYGGATVDSKLVAPYLPTVLSLKDQVEKEFLPVYGDKPDIAPWKENNSLFAIWIGINDVGNSYWEKNATLTNAIFAVYSDLVDQLYKSGARNFLFVDVPPVDRSPLTAAEGADSQALEASAIADFNGRIKKLAEKLRRDHHDASVFNFSSHAVFTKVLNDPTSFPETSIYKNTTAYCDAYQNGTPEWNSFNSTCGIPVNEYFWLNSLHPTYPMHNVTARLMAESLRHH